MNLTEELITNNVVSAKGVSVIEYEGKTIDFSRPWKRISMLDAVKEATGIDFTNLTDDKALELAREHNIEVPYNTSKGYILSGFFEKYVESSLINPTFVIDYPVEISPLSKRDPKNKAYTHRFELFINGWEFANAFSELNDPFDQYERFKDQLKQKEKGDQEAHDMDYDFVEALEVALPQQVV
jgi:lysyl-tRNA synthetase class 2